MASFHFLYIITFFLSSTFLVYGSMNLYPYDNKSLIFLHKNPSGDHMHLQDHSELISISPSGSIAAGPAIAPEGSRNEAGRQAPSSHNKKKKVKKWTLLFLGGSLVGFIGATILALLYKVVSVVIRGEGEITGCMVFSRAIKAEDLKFLQQGGVSNLEVIGRGGCGQVYKAELPNSGGKIIAIKQVLQKPMDTVTITEEDTKALNRKMRQVKAEIQIVGQIRHRNLIPLLAHVSRPSCHFLVYEFMKNGSLEGILSRDFEGTREEDWLARHKIALGIAVGLEYLHIDHSPRIIHRDLKPANVLLDDDMEAKIADFGLSKVMPDAQTHVTSTNVAGTLGYIAPEYHQTMKFTPKCDIYSFGVLLMVLVTGKLPSDNFFHERQIGLVSWIRNMMVSEDPKQAIDPRLVGNGFEEQMLLVLKIACYCVRDNPKDRPDSKEVRCMLAQIEHRVM